MDKWHQQRGAHMAEVSGWRRVVDYGDPKAEVAAIQYSVGLCDTTPLTKIDVQGRHSVRMLEGLGSIPEVGGCAPAVSAQASGTPAYIARLTRERFIILGSPEEGTQLCKRLTDAAAGDACVHVTDITSAYAVLQLAGPMSMKLLKKLGSARIDSMTTGRCLQGPLARVRVLLIRRDVGNVPSWLLLVSRDFGEYAWECVLSAGHEFGIRPFGTAAERAFTSAEATNVSVV
jgi:heterotetrameric sarcosine oxidase gamma subunit